MPTTLMQITCPSCDTSYGVDAATFPQEGRMVRCARCREVWMAHPEAGELVAVNGGTDTATVSSQEAHAAMCVESPSIADGDPPDWPTEPSQDQVDHSTPSADLAPEPEPKKPFMLSWPAPFKTAAARLWPKRKTRAATGASVKLPAIVATLGALGAGLIIWRADVVRLLPQTAICFKAIGLPVNLRGLDFKNVLVRTDTVDGANVLVIEGTIVGTTKVPMDIPKLRLIVRDDRGAEIYAWNAVLEQTVLKPGETVKFRSRLASPPAEGRNLDVRFFNRRDLARGAA